MEGFSMTFAMVFFEYGPPEVLTPLEIGDEEPGAGQVRVRVRAAGVQPFDCARRRGDLARWLATTFPWRLGNELAGVVDRVGPGVDGLAVGDEVLGFGEGCHAEAVIADSGSLVVKPPEMSWPEAGALSASGQTADTALDELGIGPGDVLLIHAAAGGVGGFAVQLSVGRGATVIGTARSSNHDYLRDLGAIPVTYGDGLEGRVRQAAPEGVTAVLDCIGGDALDVSVRLLDDHARIVTIADRAGAARLGVRAIGTDRSQVRLAKLAGLFTDGLRVPIWRTFPLRDAAMAHAEVETGHVRGKVVLTSDAV